MWCTLKCTTSEFFCIRQYSNMALAICRRRSSSINQLFLYLPSSKKTGRWKLLAVAMVWSEPLGRHAIPLKRSWCSGIPGVLPSSRGKSGGTSYVWGQLMMSGVPVQMIPGVVGVVSANVPVALLLSWEECPCHRVSLLDVAQGHLLLHWAVARCPKAITFPGGKANTSQNDGIDEVPQIFYEGSQSLEYTCDPTNRLGVWRIFVILLEDHTQLTDIFWWPATIADQMPRRIFLLLWEHLTLSRYIWSYGKLQHSGAPVKDFNLQAKFRSSRSSPIFPSG